MALLEIGLLDYETERNHILARTYYHSEDLLAYTFSEQGHKRIRYITGMGSSMDILGNFNLLIPNKAILAVLPRKLEISLEERKGLIKSFKELVYKEIKMENLFRFGFMSDDGNFTTFYPSEVFKGV